MSHRAAHQLRHNAVTTSVHTNAEMAPGVFPICHMQSFSSSVGHVAGLVSRRTLLAEGLAEAAVQFRDGRIAGELLGLDATEANILNLAAGGGE